MKLKIDLNIGPIQHPHEHGESIKTMIVLHETVSENYRGLRDILAVSEYLGTEDYGIHGITDNDGNVAWSEGHWKDIYYHTASGSGLVNSRAVGIEQISRVMVDYKNRSAQIQAWLHMKAELNATAKLCAAISNTHPTIPLLDSPGTFPGITTHWEVTRTYKVAGGHTDCWPSHLGGYYPKKYVIKLAHRYKKLGYTLP